MSGLGKGSTVVFRRFPAEGESAEASDPGGPALSGWGSSVWLVQQNRGGISLRDLRNATLETVSQTA